MQTHLFKFTHRFVNQSFIIFKIIGRNFYFCGLIVKAIFNH